ncbi:MAG: carbohydrate transporter rane protein 2, family [Rhodoglobus sp.]|nr:carbohydrate transporter rane protein 2, family [Rhodoglobus sp.]
MRKKSRLTGMSVVRGAIIALALLFAIAPIYWTINTSLKGATEVISYPPTWFPTQPTIENWLGVLFGSTFPREVLNSVLLGLGTIVIVLALGVHAGYAAARHEFRGKQSVLLILLMSTMIPGVVTIIPQYFLAVQLGLFDTYTVLLLVFSAWQLPMVVWIMKGFFEGLPRELEEAARVDGCSRLRAFYTVILPLSWPGLAASAIIVFVWVWNEFIIGLTLTQSPYVKPLTVGIYGFVGETGIDWGRITAGTAIALIPVAIFFMIFQRKFVEGLTSGSTKG